MTSYFRLSQPKKIGTTFLNASTAEPRHLIIQFEKQSGGVLNWLVGTQTKNPNQQHLMAMEMAKGEQN